MTVRPLPTRRYDLDAANRHADARRKRRQLRMWLRARVVLRMPDLRPHWPDWRIDGFGDMT